MSRICLYIVFCLAVAGCAGRNAADKKPKPREPLATFIENAYARQETDFKALMGSDTLRSAFNLVYNHKFHKFLADKFAYCTIQRDTDLVYDRVYYTVTAYADGLTVGDYTEITVNTYFTPDRDIVPGELGKIETQVDGSLIDEYGDYVTGEWKPEYNKEKNEYGETKSDEVIGLELYADGHFINLRGALRFSIDDCSAAKQLLMRDENKFVYRFNIDGASSDFVYIFNEENVAKITGLFEAKERLLLSFVDAGGKSLGTIHIGDHKAGHVVGAIRKFVSNEKAF